MKQAIILAGGKGTRLASILNGQPKPLVLIDNIPLLEYQIKYLISFGFLDIKILVNYKSELIKDFCSKKEFSSNVEIIDDGNTPLGTAGSIFKIIDLLADSFLVVYGDTYFNINLDKLSDFHLSKNSDGITLLTHPNDHPFDSDLVELNNKFEVVNFHPYPHIDGFYSANLVNAAMYLVNKAVLNNLNIKFKNKIIDFGKDVFPMLLTDKVLKSYKTFEYIKDCGTPARVERVNSHIKSGVFEKSSVLKKQKLILVDRDGTIIKEKNYLKSISQIEIFDESYDAVRKVNKKGDRIIMITNQPVIARGDVSISGLKKIHNYIEWEIGKKGGYFDDIYFCPHHPDKGFVGEIAKYKIKCTCRKPEIDMLNRSFSDYNGDLDLSWFIGDTTTDIKTANNFGIKNILLRTGYSGNDGKFNVNPDFILNNIGDAVDFIYESFDKTYQFCLNYFKNKHVKKNILISGHSRSGKSTFSSVLKYVLIDLGYDVKIISIDRFLLPLKNRGIGIRSKYDLNKINKFVEKICAKNETSEFSFSFYEKLTNSTSLQSESVKFCVNSIIIFEGLFVNDYSSMMDCDSYFITLDEQLRKERFFSEYSSRNLSPKEITDLYLQRRNSEFDEIEKVKLNAKIIKYDNNTYSF